MGGGGCPRICVCISYILGSSLYECTARFLEFSSLSFKVETRIRYAKLLDAKAKAEAARITVNYPSLLLLLFILVCCSCYFHRLL